MITHNIKWFLGASVAAHAAVLIAWQSPAYTPGNTGKTVRLSIVQRSGTITTPPSLPTEKPARTGVGNATPKRVSAEATAMRKKATTPAHKVSYDLRPTTPLRMANMTTAVAASNSVIVREETDRHLRSSVMKLIAQELTYPAIARRRGWQGVVKLELHIEANGSITGLQVSETSGYAILDKAAMQCLQLASIPDAAQWLRGLAIDIVIPIEYRLLGS